MNFKLWTSTVCAGIFGALLVSLTVWASWREPTTIPASLSLLLFGCVTGWLFGIIISPYTSNEKKEFSEYAKLVATAIGGYLAGKADTLFSKIADFDTLATVRITGTLSVFILCAIMIFYFRRYHIG